MWAEKAHHHECRWPDGIRLPIVVSVHHQSEEAAVVLPDGQVDPFDFGERQYGGRRGAWRLLEVLAKHDVKGTWITCGATAEKYPDITREVRRIGHAIAGHTYEHELMCNLPAAEELRLIRKTVAVFEDFFGERLRGWRTCFASHQTIDLLLEHFNFEWDGSIWNDDLPYVIEGHGKTILEIPFSSYADAAFAVQMTPPGVPINPYCTWHTNTPSFIYNAFKACFDALYERGEERAVLMPLAVHDFVFGRPSRAKILDDFITYTKQYEGVVFVTHDEIHTWWMNSLK